MLRLIDVARFGGCRRERAKHVVRVSSQRELLVRSSRSMFWSLVPASTIGGGRWTLLLGRKDRQERVVHRCQEALHVYTDARDGRLTLEM